MAEKVVYNDPTPNNFPNDYDDSKVDSRVKIRSKSIAHKMKGKHVRNALIQGIEIGSVVANEAKNIANDTASRQDETEKIVNDGIGAFTEDSEVVIARDGHDNLLQKEQEQDERLIGIETYTDITSDRSILSFVNDDMTEVGGPVPSYYQTMIRNIAASINNDNLNIGFITDNHHQLDDYSPNSLAHYANIATLSRLTRLDAIIAGGDNTNGWWNKPQKLVETRQAVSTLFNRASADTDVFFMMGNHDTGIGQNGNNTPDTCLSESELKAMYHTSDLIYGEVRADDSLYGYKDYSDKKVRIIWLNSFDLPYTQVDGTFKYDFLRQSAYRNAQLNWLANVALMMPANDWQVMIFTHCPLPGTFEVASGQPQLSQINSSSLIKILNAFQRGGVVNIEDDTDFPVTIDADYSAQGKGVIIGLISGHIHRDGQMTYNGINCIETAASLCYSGDKDRTKNTITEDCWDIFSVDTINRKIHVYRFGYGRDRDFTY